MAIFIKKVIFMCVVEVLTQNEEDETLAAVGHLLATQEPEEMDIDPVVEAPTVKVDGEAGEAAKSTGERSTIGPSVPVQDLNNNEVLAAFPRMQQYFKGEQLPFLCRTLRNVVALINAWFHRDYRCPYSTCSFVPPLCRDKGELPTKPGRYADIQEHWWTTHMSVLLVYQCRWCKCA